MEKSASKQDQPREILMPRPAQRMNILGVDDDQFILEFLGAQIKEFGHNFYTAENGQKALAMLDKNPDRIDIVIMDWAMPVMDGLTAIRRMKEKPALRHIPVIMTTGSNKAAGIERGLEAGVLYYLTKPVKKTILHSVISSAAKIAQQNKVLNRELRQHRASFDLIDSCKFVFRTLDEAESLAVFMANCFPDSGRVLPGLGEILTNAVEHGNLGIGYQGKCQLVESGTWREEVQRRQQLPENVEKSATVTITRKNEGIYVVIEDQGDGFEWKKYLTIDPSRAGNHNGRGIAQARAISFDKLSYNDKGNKAVAFVKKGSQLEW